jgi:hypothetical protein
MKTASNAEAIVFAACSGGTSQITHFGIGSDASGAGHLFFAGTVTTPAAGLSVSVGITPELVIGAATVTCAGSEIDVAILEHILNNADIPFIGDTVGLLQSATDGVVYVSLHTASPAGGNQTTSETAYTGHNRVAVARSGAKWIVT